MTREMVTMYLALARDGQIIAVDNTSREPEASGKLRTEIQALLDTEYPEKGLVVEEVK